ncbi:MAG: hypothetical protein AAFN93_26860 [Bacteroidota bacterium]
MQKPLQYDTNLILEMLMDGKSIIMDDGTNKEEFVQLIFYSYSVVVKFSFLEIQEVIS